MKGYLIKSLPVIWMTIISLPGFTQALSHEALGGRSTAMGNVSVALADCWSVHNNQAGMAELKTVSAGINWQNRFLVKELGNRVAGFVLPVKSGVFGADMQYFGYSLYNETKVGLAYARSFGKKFSGGVQLDYFSRHIAEGYGNAAAFTFEIGIQSAISENMILGVHVFNPVRVGYTDTESDKIPAVFSLGLAYRITEDILVSAETEKNLDFKPSVRTGFEYILVQSLRARIGFSTLPAHTGDAGFSAANLFSFGFGYEWNGFVVDLAASMHQSLGWSPAISLCYNFGKKANSHEAD